MFHSVSLNNLLVHGPDLTGNLTYVLLNFRTERIALMSDMEAMFHQIRVSKSDVDVQRFVWWPTGGLEKQPQVYRMLVHLFGATSSPSCADVALRPTN